MFNPITTSNVAPTIDAIPGGNPQTQQFRTFQPTIKNQQDAEKS